MADLQPARNNLEGRESRRSPGDPAPSNPQDAKGSVALRGRALPSRNTDEATVRLLVNSFGVACLAAMAAIVTVVYMVFS